MNIVIKMYRTGSAFIERSIYGLPAIGFDAVILVLKGVFHEAVCHNQLNKCFFIKNCWH